jgi:uncharacterized membrane protein
MKTISPTQQELQILEALRVHRRAHREVLSTQISAHVEPIKPQLTTGQKTSDVIAKTVGSWKLVNVKAELEIELLHQKIDMMKEKELYALIKAVEVLSEKLDSRHH